MRIYLICPVRRCTPEIKKKLDAYVARLEAQGHSVHYPHRDVDQKTDGACICREHYKAMQSADAIHVWWVPGISTGTYFDFGMAYALAQQNEALKFVIANPEEAPEFNHHSYFYVLMVLIGERNESWIRSS